MGGYCASLESMHQARWGWRNPIAFSSDVRTLVTSDDSKEDSNLNYILKYKDTVTGVELRNMTLDLPKVPGDRRVDCPGFIVREIWLAPTFTGPRPR